MVLNITFPPMPPAGSKYTLTVRVSHSVFAVFAVFTVSQCLLSPSTYACAVGVASCRRSASCFRGAGFPIADVSCHCLLCLQLQTDSESCPGLNQNGNGFPALMRGFLNCGGCNSTRAAPFAANNGAEGASACV